MTQTTNYGLNIVEGSDTVNLLTQMNPNTETIDAQMKKNEDHGIQEATELFTSTVHAITRLKPDANVFRFTAVSNYTAGETFTVDGVQVTALLTSGEALTTGSFIIGSEVICALRDTLLTVFVNAGTASIAKNAEKLGGELPSYYGTAEDVSSAVSNAGTALETANAASGSVGNISALTTTNKSSCVAAINEVNSNLKDLSNTLEKRGTGEVIIRKTTKGWSNGSLGDINLSDYAWIHVGNYDPTYINSMFNLCSVPIPLFKSLFVKNSEYFGNNEGNYTYYIDEHTLGVYMINKPTVIILTK